MINISDISNVKLVSWKDGKSEVLLEEQNLDYKPIEVNSKLSCGQSLECSLSIGNVELSEEIKDMLFGCDLSSQKDCTVIMEGIRTASAQKRTNKKKRINKKWLKRYGRKEINVPFTYDFGKCDMLIMDEDNTLTFDVHRN